MVEAVLSMVGAILISMPILLYRLSEGFKYLMDVSNNYLHEGYLINCK